MKRSLFTVFIGMCFLVSMGANAQETQNSITGVDVISLQGGEIVVKVAMKQKLSTAPSSFAINNPSRIAFDFPQTENALGRNLVDVGKSDLRSINVVQAGERTRLVMNLLKPVTYESKMDGSNLLITLKSTGVAPSTGTSATAQFAVPKLGEQKHSIKDIDFHRGKNGEARIEVDLSDAGTGIDIRQQGTNIIVEFIKTKLPKNLERKLDVVDFGTPVNTVDSMSSGDNVRMVVEPSGLWEQSAYQADNRFILEVKPIVSDPTKLVQGSKPGYGGDKLSLDFRNTDVRSLLFAIADFTGLNIVIGEKVSGNLTLRLKDVPWDQALDIILEHKGLGMRKNGNVLIIAPKEEIAAQEKLSLEGKQKISELEETRTETIQLNFQKAIDVQKIIGDEKQKILSKRGSVVVDPVSNALFVQDTPSKLEEIRKFVMQIDKPLKQVMIEAKIVEASDNFSRDIGVRLGYNTTQVPKTSGILIGNNAAGAPGSPGLTYQNPNVNLPANGATSAISFLLFNSSATKFLNLELSAAEQDGVSKTISSPRVVTANNQEASIESGQQIPYTVAAVSGSTTVPSTSFVNAVLSLKVKPQIAPNDDIIMNIAVSNDSAGAIPPGGSAPPINTRKITTQAVVENGGTLMLGGIHTQTDTKTVNKVPVLGDLPVLGHLFNETARQNLKTELLIFITPSILKESLNIR